MNLVELHDLDKNKYNHFIANQKSGSFLQSWDWGSWQEQLGRTVFRFALEDNTKVWLGAAQFIKMPLFGKKYYLYSPYGPVFISENETQSLEIFLKELKLKFPDMLFVRIEPKAMSLKALDTLHPIKTTNIQPGRTLIVDLTKDNDLLLNEMHPKSRYNIKVAQRHGVVVEREFDLTVGHGLFFDEAINLIVKTAMRQKYHTHPRSYYEKLMNFFALNHRGGELKASLYKAKYQNKILASAIIIDFGNTRTYLFGGSGQENRNVMAPYLMHWQAILDAKKMGLRFYDLDGLETSAGKQAQFARFKQGFGGFTEDYLGAYDIVLNGLWYNVYKVVRGTNRLIHKIY